MRIEEATEADHEAIVDLTIERLPRSTRPDASWWFEEADHVTHVHAFVARSDDGDLLGVGVGAGAGFLPAHWSLTRVVVRREHEGAGVGHALWQALLDTVDAGTTELRVGVPDEDARSLAVAEHWGFTVETHGITSELRLVDLPEPVLPDGVTLEQTSDFTFPDRDAVEAMLTASQTNPEAVTSGQVTTLAQLALPSPLATTIGVLARVDGVPAGILCGHVRDDELGIAYTGIDPAFRGRGLATVVKQRAHLLAAAAGATYVKTSNEESNAGIRRVNAELGYVVTHGSYRLGRKL